jgi:uncharacterized protein YndB with AHSA1/START domain
MDDTARVTVTVAVPVAAAFEIFTRDIDRWWRRGVRFRHAGPRRGFIRLEPHVGGRLFESIDGGDHAQVFEVGRVEAWDPPRRVAFTWRNANFAPGENSAVEVLFSPTATGTRVCVTHRGLAALRPDHPARHGLQGAEFNRQIAMWWGEQMSAWRELCAERDGE